MNKFIMSFYITKIGQWIKKEVRNFILFSVILISLGAIIVHADEKKSWIEETMDAAQEAITAEIITSLADQAVATANAGIDGFILTVSEVFNPSLNLFYNMAKGNSDITSNENFATDYEVGENNLVTFFHEYASYAGATLAVVLFSFGIFLYIVATKRSRTSYNPIQLVIFYGIALLGIYYTEDIMNEFLEIAQLVWEWVLGKGNQLEASIDASDFFVFKLTRGSSGALTAIAFFNIATMAFKSVVVGILSFVGLYLSWQLFKGFLKLWLEMCERYLVVCFLVFFAPIIYPTIISRDTTQIMKSYLRMLTSQLFLLVTGYVMMKGYVVLMDTGVQFSVLGFIFMMAYLRTAQRLDSYMASMGLNVAQTGTGLFDSFAMAGHAIMATARGANELRKGTAGVMKATALNTGNRQLYSAASALGFNMRDTIQAGGIRNVGSDMDFLKNVGLVGNKLGANTVSSSVAKEAVNKFVQNPSRDNLAAIRAMHSDDLMKALQTSGAVPKGMQLTGATIDGLRGNIKLQGIGKDGSSISGTISGNKLNQNSIKTSAGNYYTPDKTLNKGSVVPIKNSNDLNSALMRAGYPNVSSNISTMEQYKQAMASGSKSAAEQMKQEGIVEALYEKGGNQGLQMLTGENSPYGAGIPLGSINNDGDVMMYSRFSADADLIKAEGMSAADKNQFLYGQEFEDRGHLYDSDNLPSIDEAMANLSQEDKDMIGYGSNNLGYGYDSAQFVRDEESGQSYLKVGYKDYDFSREELSNLYPEWDVVDGAEPQRTKYGQQSIEVYNSSTGESGNMFLSSSPVYGEQITDQSRLVTGRYGDDYVVTVQKTKIDMPELDIPDNYSSAEMHHEVPFKESPARFANQRGYEDAFVQEVSQDAIDRLEAERKQNSSRRGKK